MSIGKVSGKGARSATRANVYTASPGTTTINATATSISAASTTCPDASTGPKWSTSHVTYGLHATSWYAWYPSKWNGPATTNVGNASVSTTTTTRATGTA